MDFTRLFELPDYQKVRYPRADALAGKLPDGTWQKWNTDAFIAERDRMSAGLLELKLHKGQRVAIIAHKGSPQWAIADAAMMQIGLVPVPIHSTARPNEIAHILRDAAVQAVFVSNADLLAKVRDVAPAELHLYLGLEDVAGATPWNSICCEPDEHDLGKIKYIRDGILPHDLATILYTSGTTGVPKGVMLSHDNIVSNIKSILAIVPVDSTVVAVSYLPLSHILERTVCYLYQAAGAGIWYADAIETLSLTLKEARPHFFTAVPRILERSYEQLLDQRDKAGYLKKKILDWAIELGARYPYAGSQAMPLNYRMSLWIADLLVFRHWRKAMGGRVKAVVVGAAALQPRLGRLFSAAGVDVREGYGLTETSPVIAFNRFEPGGVHFGTVGIAVPGVEVRIATIEGAEYGEIEVRGPNVMLGYLNLPEETAARFTADGWLRTGDLGQIEHKRFLRITGRQSEVFKTTAGKFVAPVYVEQQLLSSPFIDQCMVVGLNKPYVAALIVPNFQHLEAWCIEQKVHWTAPQFMILNPKVEKIIHAEVDRINNEYLGNEEKVKKIALLYEPWSTANGLLTPTLKLRRDAIAQAHEQVIHDLFH